MEQAVIKKSFGLVVFLVLFVIGVGAVLVIQLRSTLLALGYESMENEILHTFPSPDHTRSIVEFYRYGGVGSDLIREFSELRTGQRFGNEEGNLFRCSVDGDWHGYDSPSPVKVNWIDNLHVQLTYPKNLDFIETAPEHQTQDVFVSFNPR